MSRPKGSKNKTKATSNLLSAAELVRLAEHFATVFICSYHLDGAEHLAQLTLEKIRAKQNVHKSTD